MVVGQDGALDEDFEEARALLLDRVVVEREVVVEVVQRVRHQVAVVAVGAGVDELCEQAVHGQRERLVDGEHVEVVGNETSEAVNEVRNGVVLQRVVVGVCEEEEEHGLLWVRRGRGQPRF